MFKMSAFGVDTRLTDDVIADQLTPLSPWWRHPQRAVPVHTTGVIRCCRSYGTLVWYTRCSWLTRWH